MKIDPTKLLMVYSAVLTVGAVGMMSTGGAVAQSGGAASGKASFDTIDVKRINVREDDGTLRVEFSNGYGFTVAADECFAAWELYGKRHGYMACLPGGRVRVVRRRSRAV